MNSRLIHGGVWDCSAEYRPGQLNHPPRRLSPPTTRGAGQSEPAGRDQSPTRGTDGAEAEPAELGQRTHVETMLQLAGLLGDVEVSIEDEPVGMAHPAGRCDGGADPIEHGEDVRPDSRDGGSNGATVRLLPAASEIARSV